MKNKEQDRIKDEEYRMRREEEDKKAKEYNKVTLFAKEIGNFYYYKTTNQELLSLLINYCLNLQGNQKK